jgi:hypothetical protein
MVMVVFGCGPWRGGSGRVEEEGFAWEDEEAPGWEDEEAPAWKDEEGPAWEDVAASGPPEGSWGYGIPARAALAVWAEPRMKFRKLKLRRS